LRIRVERIKALIQQITAEFILNELCDPRLGFCTVTKVDLTDDLSYAQIYVSVMGTEAEKRTTMRGLEDARGAIQKRIAQNLKTRTTPHVEVKLDESIDREFQIFEKIREARASDTDGGKDTAPEVQSEEDDTDEEKDEEKDEE